MFIHYYRTTRTAPDCNKELITPLGTFHNNRSKAKVNRLQRMVSGIRRALESISDWVCLFGPYSCWETTRMLGVYLISDLKKHQGSGRK